MIERPDNIRDAATRCRELLQARIEDVEVRMDGKPVGIGLLLAVSPANGRLLRRA